MNRINRISAILIQLQSQRVVRAKDIAETFSISLRTVYRDIRTLEEAGIPILSEAGVGYSIMKGYSLPPLMFTHDEAIALLTAKKFVEKMSDKSIDSAYSSALLKIKAVLKMTEKDSLEILDPRIEVLKRPGNLPNFQDMSFATILKSISEKCVVSIKYQAGIDKNKTERDIEPIGIFYNEDYWYTIAFCRLRNNYRNFRLDRIQNISLTKNYFVDEHPTLKEYLEQVSEKKQIETIVVSFHKSVVNYTDKQKFYFGFVRSEIQGNRTVMTFFTNQIDEMAHWLLMFTDKIEVHSPQFLISKIKSLVNDLNNHY